MAQHWEIYLGVHTLNLIYVRIYTHRETRVGRLQSTFKTTPYLS